MKKGRVFYSFIIVLAVIAIFYGSRLSVSAKSGGETHFVFVDQVSEFFGLQGQTAETQSVSDEVSPSFGGVPVSLPIASSSPSTIVTIPVTTGDVTGLSVTSFDFQVTFNPAILTPASPAFDQAGTLSSSMLVTPNTAFPGHLIMSGFQGTFLAGGGTLINLKFNVVGTLGGQTTTLVFEDYTDPGSTFHPGFAFNEGDPAAVITNGSFTVAGPTPTSTNTATQTPTFTPSNTETSTPTDTPTFTPTNTATSTPSASPLNTPPPTLGVYPATSVALKRQCHDHAKRAADRYDEHQRRDLARLCRRVDGRSDYGRGQRDQCSSREYRPGIIYRQSKGIWRRRHGANDVLDDRDERSGLFRNSRHHVAGRA